MYDIAKNTAWWNGPWPPNVFNAPDDAKSELKKVGTSNMVLFSSQTISGVKNPHKIFELEQISQSKWIGKPISK